ncbi:MAG UNVERIFIED_CONTAM: DUF1501 domain-containing protein [Planctomycetaceae bacterium]
MLQAGLSGLAGLSLPGLLRQTASAAQGKTTVARPVRSVIQIWLSGGPSQIDMWDMKPEQPPEIRGPFRPISTCVPGVQICEHLPLQAKMLDRYAIVRSMDASSSNHTPITFQAGNPKAQRTEIGRQGGGIPSMGAVAARFQRRKSSGNATLRRAWQTAWFPISTGLVIWDSRTNRWTACVSTGDSHCRRESKFRGWRIAITFNGSWIGTADR